MYLEEIISMVVSTEWNHENYERLFGSNPKTELKVS